METRTHRPDLHVLQYLGDYTNCNLESTMDLAQLPGCHRYGNISYEAPEMLTFASSSPLLVAHRSDVMNVNQELSGTSSSRMDSNNALFISSTQNCGSWNVVNPNIQSPMFVGGSYPGVLSPNNAALSLANNQSNEIHGQYTQKQFEDMQHEFASSSSHYRSSSSVQEANSNGDSHRWQDGFEGEAKPTDVPHIPHTQALSLSLSSVSPSRMNPRCVVPFGPFTGYATILRSSRFLKPAQQLLDELCTYSGHMGVITRMSEHSEKVWDEVNLSSDVIVNAANTYSVESSNQYHQRSEYQQTRVKLLHMQDEVCRKYSQYRQQMQMVVSSFESVAGLSAATPYIFLALKAIARSFSSLNNAISDQLKNTCKAMGEDKLLSPTGKGKGDRVSSSLKLVDHHGVEKHSGSSMGFLDPPQPHAWRPQRGLPERAVSVLRAWLFDHFLHPYPTDTDKHMLATQTGLSRNQVSNWFINARVRVWKPMVEEIHMLETKAMAAQKDSKAREDGATHPKIHSNTAPYPTTGPHPMSVATGMGATTSYIGENQSRISDNNCPHLPPGMDGPTLMGFMPYPQGNLGSVSLTLGLRQSADGTTQKQGHQQHQQLGSLVHDYFG